MLKDKSEPELDKQQAQKVPLIDEEKFLEALRLGTPAAMAAGVESAVENQIANLVADLMNEFNNLDNIQKN
jgi:glycine/serine hydroxymethyltransferase